MSTKKAALLGFGVVGREVYGYFQENPVIEIKSVLVRDRAKERTYEVDGEVRDLTQNSLATIQDILQDEQIEIIIELTGDSNADDAFILPALKKKKHVVTANKLAMLNSWEAISSAAAANGVICRYDATVGGGVPIIRSFEQHLAQDRVTRFAGILNGTCNFVLSSMWEEMVADPDSNPQMQKWVNRAIKDGFAEPNPTADLDGTDTRRKVAILANLAFGATLSPDDVYCEGIRDYANSVDIEAADFEFAARLMNPRGIGYEIKLLGVAEYIRAKESVMAATYPCLVAKNTLLANILGNFNGIVIQSDRLQTQFMYGAGAGARPTAISIAAGVHDILLDRVTTKPRAAIRRTEPFGSVITQGFFRSYSPDVPGIFLDKLRVISNEHGVNVEELKNLKKAEYRQFVQYINGKEMMPDYIVISDTENERINAALKSLRALPDVEKATFIRIFNE